VANAIKLTGSEGAQETAKFIEYMDKFFDCLNVTSFSMGKRKRKPFQQPYRKKDDPKAEDFRLTVYFTFTVLCYLILIYLVSEGTN